jgi:hypothetical protein
MSKPKGLVTISESKYHFTGDYNKCEIILDRMPGRDWYIIVSGADGSRLYDGWWRHSSNASVDEALKEALEGAQL